MFKFVHKRWFRIVWQTLLVLAVIAGVRAYVARNAVSGPAPPFAGVTLDGQPVSLDRLRGRPVLVHFWATWCPICRMEEDSIADIARNYAVVAVATQSGDAMAVEAYLREHGLKMPVLLDEDGALARRYGATGTPASFILDREGRIRFVEFGYTTEMGLRLRLWLAGL